MPTTSLIRNLGIPFLILVVTAHDALSAGVPDCSQDAVACIRLAAAETAAFVEECGKVFPPSKAELDTALAGWSILKLRIAGVEEAMKPGSPERLALGKKAAAYLKSVGSYEREIECTGRMAVLKNKELRIRSDFVLLPTDPLEPYR